MMGGGGGVGRGKGRGQEPEGCLVGCWQGGLYEGSLILGLQSKAKHFTLVFNLHEHI